MHQRVRLNLPFTKPSGKSWSKYCPSGLGRGTGPRQLARGTTHQRVLPRSHRDVRHTHKQAHNKEKEIKVLSLSLNQEKLRYRYGKNIFGRFSNGVLEIMLEKVY